VTFPTSLERSPAFAFTNISKWYCLDGIPFDRMGQRRIRYRVLLSSMPVPMTSRAEHSQLSRVVISPVSLSDFGSTKKYRQLGFQHVASGCRHSQIYWISELMSLCARPVLS
jgi:hypothetical protein